MTKAETQTRRPILITVILVFAAVAWGVNTINDFSVIRLVAFLACATAAILSVPRKRKAE